MPLHGVREHEKPSDWYLTSRVERFSQLRAPATENSGTLVTAPPARPIKGNVNNKGERIHHKPGDGDYRRSVMNLKNAKYWFCSAAEAEAAGWRHVLR